MEVFILMRHDVRDNESSVMSVYKNYQKAKEAKEIYNKQMIAYKYCWICIRTIVDE